MTQVTDTKAYHSDGRLRGAFVYMLLCQDNGPVLVKIGVSGSPTKRLYGLIPETRAIPRQFLFMEVRSKRKALEIERGLVWALAQWLEQGREWFIVPVKDKTPFNLAWQQVITAHREIGWPLRWERLSVPEILKNRRRGPPADLPPLHFGLGCTPEVAQMLESPPPLY